MPSGTETCGFASGVASVPHGREHRLNETGMAFVRCNSLVRPGRAIQVNPFVDFPGWSARGEASGRHRLVHALVGRSELPVRTDMVGDERRSARQVSRPDFAASWKGLRNGHAQFHVRFLRTEGVIADERGARGLNPHVSEVGAQGAQTFAERGSKRRDGHRSPNAQDGLLLKVNQCGLF